MTGPTRPFTGQQQRVAHGIDRGLSYKEIAAELGVSVRTVEGHVREMAHRLDEPRELPPRWRILFWIRQGRWEAQHATSLPRSA